MRFIGEGPSFWHAAHMGMAVWAATGQKNPLTEYKLEVGKGRKISCVTWRIYICSFDDDDDDDEEVEEEPNSNIKVSPCFTTFDFAVQSFCVVESMPP